MLDPSSLRAPLVELLPKRAVCAETGVHGGDFSQQILDRCSPATLHLIDPWKFQPSPRYNHAFYGGKAAGGQREMDSRHQKVCTRFAAQIRSGQVKVNRGDSAEVLEQFPDGYFDWVYIDGNHFYEFVKQDLDLSLKKTRGGGYITGDDYAWDARFDNGIKRAVDEFAQGDSVALIEIRNQQFIFRKKA